MEHLNIEKPRENVDDTYKISMTQLKELLSDRTNSWAYNECLRSLSKIEDKDVELATAHIFSRYEADSPTRHEVDRFQIWLKNVVIAGDYNEFGDHLIEIARNPFDPKEIKDWKTAKETL